MYQGQQERNKPTISRYISFLFVIKNYPILNDISTNNIFYKMDYLMKLVIHKPDSYLYASSTGFLGRLHFRCSKSAQTTAMLIKPQSTDQSAPIQVEPAPARRRRRVTCGEKEVGGRPHLRIPKQTSCKNQKSDHFLNNVYLFQQDPES